MKTLMTIVTCYTLFFSSGIWAATSTTSDQTAANNSTVLTVDNEVTKAETDKGASSALTLSSLSIFASGVMGPMYVMWCSNQPSAWIYAGTAAIYVGSEFVNWSKYKDASNRVMQAFLGQEVNSQIESLTSAEKQTREAANAAKRKALFAKLASAGYTAAAAVALMEQLQFWGAGGMCSGPVREISPIGTGGFSIAQSELDIIKTSSHQIANAKNDLNALMIFNQFKNTIEGKMHSPTLSQYHDSSKFLTSTPEMSGIKAGLLLAFKGIEASIFTNAQAGFADNKLEKAGIFLGLAGAAAVYMWGEKIAENLGLSNAVTKSGYSRAAVFGAHAAVALVAGTQITEAQKKLDARADQYHQLAMQLKQMGEGTVTTGTTTDLSNSTDKVNEESSMDNNLAFSDLQNSNCFVETSKNETLADSTCSCKKTNSCKQVKMPEVEFKGISMPSSLSRSLSGIKQTGNSLYSGDYLEASTNANGVLNNAAAVGKLQDALVKKINERLTKEGKKAVNFNRAKSTIAGSFNRATAKSLKNMKASDALAVRQMALGTNGEEKLADATSKGSSEEQSKLAVTAAKDQAQGAQGEATTGATDPFGNLNFEVADGANAAQVNKGETAANTEEGYEYGDKEGEQISDKPGVSLFSLISNRYLKTAFPRLFNEQN